MGLAYYSKGDYSAAEKYIVKAAQLGSIDALKLCKENNINYHTESGGSVLEAALQEDPELVYTIIKEFSQISSEVQQQLMAEIERELQNGKKVSYKLNGKKYNNNSVLKAALMEDAEMVYAIIMEFSQLSPEEQTALMQEIENTLNSKKVSL